MKKIVLVSIAIIACCSCSIKEDRTECPCWLDVYVPSVLDSTRHDMTLILQKQDGSYYEKKLVASDNEELRKQGFVSLTPPRGVVDFAAVTGNTVPLPAGAIEFRPERNAENEIDYPKLFTDYAMLRCFEESKTYTVAEKKQFCKFSVRLHQSYLEANPGAEIKVTICGKAVGLNLFETSPIHGDFKKSVIVDSLGRGSINLPRQNVEDSLSVKVTIAGVKYVDTQIGSSLVKRGYLWTKDNLDDIDYFIDQLSINSIITVIPWEAAMDQDITI